MDEKHKEDKNTAVDDKSNESPEEKEENSCMVEGMCLGMCFGMFLGQLLFKNIGTGMCMGMCLGLGIGSVIKKKK